MSFSSSEALSVIAHELAHPLARMGSEADILALEALKELKRAYGPDPRYEAAEKNIIARRELLREAHKAAVSALGLVRLMREPIERSTKPHLRSTSLIALITESIDQVSFPESRVRILAPEGQTEAVCDKGLLTIALINVLSFGLKHSRSQATMWVRLMRDGNHIIISLPFYVPVNKPLGRDNLGILIAQRILALHNGTLVSQRSEQDETQLRWPAYPAGVDVHSP